MGITNANKFLCADSIDCRGTLKVTLTLAASPDITKSPTDIVLILDRSGSMAGAPLANMKLGAKAFIDIIDEATDGSLDGNIGDGSHLGIVSFSTVATKDTQLITSVSALKSSVDAINAGGSTNHADAFTKAMELFDSASTNAKVIVMFTDGKTTEGVLPAPVAAAARASGIIIYCIGLTGSGGVDEDALKDWATNPDSSHVVLAPDDQKLKELFEDMAKNISKPGATNIVINETINPDFIITEIIPPGKGSAEKISDRTLKWKIDKLGVVSNEGATLDFYIRHTAETSGIKDVNASITYADSEGNSVDFPTPAVNVSCREIVHPEKCPVPVDTAVEGCTDSLIYASGDSYMESLGRIMHLDITLKHVCPNRRVALAVIVTEVDAIGKEHKRGMKTIAVPAHHADSCRDVLVKCIKFVLPEELDVSGFSPDSICNDRSFRVRTISHYIDNDYDCCNDVN